KAKAAEEAKSKANAEQQKAQAAQEQTKTQNEAQATDVNNGAAPQGDTSVSGGAVDYGQYAQAPAQNTPSYNPPATGGNGGGAVAPSAPSQNTGNSDYNNGGGANANPNQSINDIDNATENANNSHGNDGVVNGGW